MFHVWQVFHPCACYLSSRHLPILQHNPLPKVNNKKEEKREKNEKKAVMIKQEATVHLGSSNWYLHGRLSRASVLHCRMTSNEDILWIPGCLVSSLEPCGTEKGYKKRLLSILTLDKAGNPLENGQHILANLAPETHQERTLPSRDWSFHSLCSKCLRIFVPPSGKTHCICQSVENLQRSGGKFMVTKNTDRLLGLCLI